MNARSRRKRLRRDSVPLWLSIVIDAFIVSLPCIIRKLMKLIKTIGE